MSAGRGSFFIRASIPAFEVAQRAGGPPTAGLAMAAALRRARRRRPADGQDALAGHRRKIRGGVFKSVSDLDEVIRRYIRDHNGQAKPFVCTKTAEVIFENLSRLPTHDM
jgi:hypothetical protein